MMRTLVWLFLSLLSAMAYSMEETDTLFSSANDRVIVNYDVIWNNGNVSIRFNDVRKKLGRSSSGKYKKLDEVVVLFFDRTGGFHDVKFTGINTESFMTPDGVNYQKSDDGFFLLNDQPVLKLDCHSGNARTLSVPLYLAHYEGKKYNVFASCGNLDIRLEKNGTSGKRTATGSSVMPVVETVTYQEEVGEGGFSMENEALIRVRNVENLLLEQDRLPLSEELTHEVSMLRELRYKVADSAVSQKISEALSRYDEVKKKLESQADAQAQAAQAQAEKAAEEAARKAEAKQDSIAAAAHEQAEKDKTRNVWMMIGGALLAVLLFGGNQLIMSIRNKRNMKGVEDMTKSIEQQAKNEIRRRAQGAIRNTTGKISRNVRQKGREYMSNTLNGVGKNKKGGKNISI